MKDRKKVLKEITDEILLSSVCGGGGYSPGPSYIWGGVMGGIKPCSWPGDFYGPPNTMPPSGMCSS